MDDIRVGRVIRAVRLRAGLTQAEVGRKAGVAQATVSRLERGLMETVGLALARRVCRALQIGLPLLPRWRGADVARLLDARHAALVDAVARELVKQGWEVVVECTYNHFGERGSVDLLGWHEVRRALLTRDEERRDRLPGHVQHDGSEGQDRSGPRRSRQGGWAAKSVGVLLVLPETSSSRAVVARHEALFRASLPASNVQIRRWVADPVGPLRGVWFFGHGSPGSRHTRSRRVGRRGPSQRISPSPGAEQIVRQTRVD